MSSVVREIDGERERVAGFGEDEDQFRSINVGINVFRIRGGDFNDRFVVESRGTKLAPEDLGFVSDPETFGGIGVGWSAAWGFCSYVDVGDVVVVVHNFVDQDRTDGDRDFVAMANHVILRRESRRAAGRTTCEE